MRKAINTVDGGGTDTQIDINWHTDISQTNLLKQTIKQTEANKDLKKTFGINGFVCLEIYCQREVKTNHFGRHKKELFYPSSFN